MQEEKEKREIPTPAILLTMLGQLNDKAFEKEAASSLPFDDYDDDTGNN